ncbi:MAG: hypothetical protein HZC47_07790 [Methanobacterium sp.]|uniref:DUF5750 family protein n=1 Tax=Methanobacterium sp. TaxID=2164 RepID=UPI003D64E3F0|nr:hypothetical protein [Methanobacterium sp.]
MHVKITDYGVSKKLGKYYVIYQITNIDKETTNKIKELVKEKITDKSGVLYLTAYFDKEFFPFKSKEAKLVPSDFVAREEIEMTAYLTSILED